MKTAVLGWFLTFALGDNSSGITRWHQPVVIGPVDETTCLTAQAEVHYQYEKFWHPHPETQALASQRCSQTPDTFVVDDRGRLDVRWHGGEYRHGR